MRQIGLLGSPGTKRTLYLQQALEQAGIQPLFMDWKDFAAIRETLLKRSEGKLLIKVDPPSWDSCRLHKLDDLAAEYRQRLGELAQTGRSGRITYLNPPDMIEMLLDKRSCKRALVKAGLPVTEELPGLQDGEDGEADTPKGQPGVLPAAFAGKNGQSHSMPASSCLADRLLERMRAAGIFQVFLKPVWGSGAAGVSALRWQPATGQMVLYTCSLLQGEHDLVNTKRLRCFHDPAIILPFLEEILGLGCIVERWYAKMEYRGFSCDLRAVVQDGRVDFLVARLSKGPITNLHLNNHPLSAEELDLPAGVMDSVHTVCIDAMKPFPGLRSAGIDLLLEKGSLRPRIIEMNGQGDLMYQDIYQKNTIYRHQAEMMKRWLQEPDAERFGAAGK